MLDKSTQAGRAPLAEHRGDFYDTPPEAVRALLAVEDVPPVVWEPACGIGNIVGVLRESGRVVMATDLNSRGCPHSVGGVDFLMERVPPGTEVAAIVTNPPYALAGAFVDRGLELVPRVMMLLRLAFLESERRSPILDGGMLARVHVFRRRLPMMHRAGWDGPKARSAVAFAWFVWDREHKGPTTIDRISW